MFDENERWVERVYIELNWKRTYIKRDIIFGVGRLLVMVKYLSKFQS